MTAEPAPEPEDASMSSDTTADPPVARRRPGRGPVRRRPAPKVVFDVQDLNVYYGAFRAVRDVNLEVHQHEITAFIGPSGCGKSTVLRCFNRMNDLIESARVEGKILYHGVDLYDSRIDPVEVRKRIGMVFQKPNPFPKSIYDNIAFGPRLAGVRRTSLDDLVEQALRQAALWDEVKDRLKDSAMGLSGGQQQRLCIARAVAVEPEVVLMDEPCSALDPIATARIEDLMQEIKAEYTILIVTHNMQQAARVSDRTAFFTTEVNDESDTRTGLLVEYDATDKIFSAPPTSGRRTMSPADSADGGAAAPPVRRRARAAGAPGRDDGRGGRPEPRAHARGPAHRRRATSRSRRSPTDDDIDAMNVSLIERCYELLRREAPVASDLRLIVSVLRVTAELERIGDLALRVVKLASRPRTCCSACPAPSTSCRRWRTTPSSGTARRCGPGRPTTWTWPTRWQPSPGAASPPASSSRPSLAYDGPDGVAVTLRTMVAGQALDRIADHAAILGARLRYLITGDPDHLAAEVR